MAINKVKYGNTVLIDLTADTVTAANLATGIKAHGKNGNVITGIAAIDANANNPVGIINVSYPAGDVCTCTNGTVSLTAPNTLGSCIFHVPSTGDWTVSATTSGENTVTKSVNISASGQIKSLTLSHELNLFDAATGIAPVLGDIKSGSNSIQKGSAGAYYLQLVANGNGQPTSAYATSTNNAPFGAFNTLKIICDGTVKVYAGEDVALNCSNVTKAETQANPPALDISNVSDDKLKLHVSSGISNGAWVAKSFKVYKIWLE